MQSPGLKALDDPSQYKRLEVYVKGVVGAFGSDNRVLAWDLWNEPDNLSDSSYSDPHSKVNRVLELLPRVFEWARAANPQQPLTSGVWKGDWSTPEKLGPMEKIQVNYSDVISFHNYEPPEDFEKHVQWLKQYGRAADYAPNIWRGCAAARFRASSQLRKSTGWPRITGDS